MFASSKLLLDDEAATSQSRSRGQQALMKERLHQDYRQLLGDLQTLAREERLIHSTPAHRVPVSSLQTQWQSVNRFVLVVLNKALE
jgi:predicted component of type VI protein secretion system